MQTRRALTIVIAILVLIAGFTWAFRAPPVAVDLAEIKRGSIEVSVADEGVTRIREVFTMSAPISGRVLRSPLEVGDLVVRNETVVAIIEPQAPSFLDTRLRGEAQASVRAADAALTLAKAEVDRAEAELRYWRSELARNEVLRARDTISEKALEQTLLELDIRNAALATAKANVEVRRQELRRAQAILVEPDATDETGRAECCMQIRSPVSGRVLELTVESEQVVASGAPLLSIGDPRDLEIVVDLLSADAVKVAPGAAAEITRWGGPKALAAKVSYTEPAGFTKVSALGIDEQRVNVILEITSDRDEWLGLGHAFRVFARIYTDGSDDVLLIPMSALFRQGDDWAVFAVEDGVARLKIIEIGLKNADSAELIAGLAAGAQVVLHPSDRIADGVEIVPRAEL